MSDDYDSIVVRVETKQGGVIEYVKELPTHVVMLSDYKGSFITKNKYYFDTVEQRLIVKNSVSKQYLLPYRYIRSRTIDLWFNSSRHSIDVNDWIIYLKSKYNITNNTSTHSYIDEEVLDFI